MIKSVETAIEHVDRAIENATPVDNKQSEIKTPIGEVPIGIKEITDATDELAATVKEVALMLGSTVEGSQNIAAEIQTLVGTNSEQAENFRNVRCEVRELESELYTTPMSRDIATLPPHGSSSSDRFSCRDGSPRSPFLGLSDYRWLQVVVDHRTNPASNAPDLFTTGPVSGTARSRRN